MPEKDPTSYSFLTYVWVFGLAILGGVVSFMRKLQDGHAKVFNLVEFFGEIVTSAFAGVIAQQVQAVMPEIVAPAPIDEKYLTVRYERLAPLFIEAIKELSAEVKALKAKVG